MDHERLLRVLAERVADPRILRLVRRWLRAGVLEGTEWHETEQGTPQGAGISPLLANIFPLPQPRITHPLLPLAIRLGTP